jgi:thioredoxin 2
MEYEMSERVKVSCLGCGTTNYYPLGVQGKSVICGKCKRPLPVPGMLLEPLPGMTHELFRNSAIPILVEFYSQSCAPCAGMEPILAGVAERRKGELMVIKISLDRHPEMGASFGILGVPSFLVIQKGTERGRMSGALPEADFVLWLAKLV